MCCTILHCNVPYRDVLHCTVLCCAVLHCTSLRHGKLCFPYAMYRGDFCPGFKAIPGPRTRPEITRGSRTRPGITRGPRPRLPRSQSPPPQHSQRCMRSTNTLHLVRDLTEIRYVISGDTVARLSYVTETIKHCHTSWGNPSPQYQH
jgi:hypothetical protein